MPDAPASLALSAAAVLATYLLHSTLLLLLVWFVLRVSRTTSHLLEEQMWKAAAVAGVLTTSIHLSFGIASPVVRLPLARETPAAIEQPLAETVREHPGDRVLGSMRVAGRHAAAPERAVPPVESPPQLRPAPRTPAGGRTQASVPRRPSPGTRPLDAEVPFAPTVVDRGDVPSASPPPPDETNLPDEARAASNNAPVVSVASGAATETDPPAESESWDFRSGKSLISIVLAVGILAACLLGRFLLQMLACRRRAARWKPLESEQAAALLDELRAAAGIRRRATLFSSSVYSEPVAFGVFRWRIVLPDGLEKDFPRGELQALLAHELAHLVRGDALWVWIGHVLCSLLAFQPLNFLARRRWRRAAEFQCDDWAVRHSVPPLALARCLTRVAERRQSRRACAAALSAVGAKSSLSSRVERLVAETKRTDPWESVRRRRLVEAAIIVVVGGLAVWGPSAVIPALSRPRDVQAAGAPDNAPALVGREADRSETLIPERAPADSVPRVTDFEIDFETSPDADLHSTSSPIADRFDGPSESELERLEEELNRLVSESRDLLAEFAFRPELRPAAGRLVERIDALKRKIETLKRHSDKLPAPAVSH